ncbi:MAG: hypothetical protein U0746_21480 [Gemmataceae bacterium]
MAWRTFSRIVWPLLATAVGGAFGAVAYGAAIYALLSGLSRIYPPVGDLGMPSDQVVVVFCVALVGFPLAVVFGGTVAAKVVAGWFEPTD